MIRGPGVSNKKLFATTIWEIAGGSLVRESGAYGIILILIAGLLQGTFMLPIKHARRWEWETRG